MTYQPAVRFSCVKCKNPKTVARKLCRTCYNQERKANRLGDYALLGPSDVFEGRFEKTDGCWEWKGTRNGYGYGIFLLPGEKQIRAHRYAYEFFTGKKIPQGMVIMHSCDNPPCVNPEHLRVATKGENNTDTANKNRHNYGTDHWNGRLTQKDIDAVRSSKETKASLSRKYGVSYSHIWRIIHGNARRVK